MRVVSQEDSNSNIIPFGKHKGTDISEVPDDYILFLAYKFDKESKWYTIAEAELNKRELSAKTVIISFGKYEGYKICELPDDYIKWCLLNMEDSPLYPLIAIEFEERGLDLCGQG